MENTVGVHPAEKPVAKNLAVAPETIGLKVLVGYVVLTVADREVRMDPEQALRLSDALGRACGEAILGPTR